MSTYLHPGVYVQELPAAVKPIAGVSTSTAGFIGTADCGPLPGFEMPSFAPTPTPQLVTSFAAYTRLFGGYRADSYLTYAVQSFFANGGSSAYIVRVAVQDDPGTGSPPQVDNVALAGLGLAGRDDNSTTAVLGVIANSPGAWANPYGIAIGLATHDPGDTSLFSLTLMQGGVPVESYDDLSMDPTSPAFVETVVNSRSATILVKVPPTVTGDPADIRPAATSTLELSVSGKAFLDVTSPAYFAGGLVVATTPASTPPGTHAFSLQVSAGSTVLESFDGLSLDPASGSYVERRINGVSAYISVAVPDGGGPAGAASVTFAAAPVPTICHPATGAGSDGRTIPQGDLHFLGDPSAGTGIYAFDGVTDVNLIAIPGGGNDLIASGGMSYCRNRPLQDAFFVADLGLLDPVAARSAAAVPDVHTVSGATSAVLHLSTPTDYGAIYYPWLRVADPIGQGLNPTIALPPSGFVAGLYARTDAGRGVFKSPAGTDSSLAGALDVLDSIDDAAQDSMNPIGLNAIRRFAGAGIVSWGARTVSPDPAWRYIAVRRTAIFLRASIYAGIQWAVFEPNDEPLWSELRLNIRAFMLTQFRAGAFQGSTPDAAFFVACDDTTTTQQDIDNGVVNILVGFAPLKPAEFVVLKLSQKVNQSA